MFNRYSLLATLPALTLCTAAAAAETWDAPAFSAPAAQLLQAAAAVKRERPTSVVVMLDERIFVFDEQRRLTRTSHIIYRVNTPDGVESWASTSAQWQPWHQAKPELRARVISGDGTEHELDQKLLSDAGTRGASSQVYDDDHVLEGPLPAIAVGAVVEEQITVRDEKPFFDAGSVSRVFVGRSVPVMLTRVIIEAPESLPLKHALRLLSDARVSETHANGRVRWTLENGPIDERTSMESNLPPETPRWASVEFSSGTSWESVAASYREMSEARIRNDDAKPLIADMKPPGASSARTDYIGKLVERLHSQVRYTGVEFGAGQLIPEFPSETLRRKFGDCKDKSTLLVAALRASGIDAYLALLSADDDQDVSPDLPGMGMFDHAIVFVPSQVPGEPDLWIDATAEYARVGTLPAADTGRLALIIRANEKALTRTPDLKSADNTQVETREFFLAERGPARVIETTETRGIIEIEYRSWYAGADTKERREMLERYVKSAYRAKALSNYEHTSSDDFSKLYKLKLEMQDAPAGSTDLSVAAVGVNLGNITTRLPGYFSKEDEDDSAPARTTDVVFAPSVTEWHYRIQPPLGFKARRLPDASVLNLGPAKLTADFSTGDDGSVLANWRFDTGKSRYTQAESKELIKSLKELKDHEVTLITFEHAGSALRADGDFKGSLRAYDDLVSQEPKHAIHHLRYAYALLEAGLGARAQHEALAATKLDPKSAYAWRVQGWMLQHDAVGRRFGAGFDRAGAIAAYRKARELDPKDADIAAELAVLYEHDAHGLRYADQDGLKLAIAEYQARAKLLTDKEAESDTFTDNLPYALLFAHRYAEVRDALRLKTPSATRRSMTLAAIAASDGSAKAIDAARDIANEEKDRRAALESAGGLLINLREYTAATDLIEASARGQTATAATTQRIAMLRKTTRVDRSGILVTDARSAVMHLFAVLLSPDEKPAAFRATLSKLSLDSVGGEEDIEGLRRTLAVLRSRSDVPSEVSFDLVMSNMRLSLEGDDANGYRAQIRFGPSTQNVYLVKEDGAYRVLAISPKVGALGIAALQRLDAGDLPGARQWLDWAKLEQRVSNSEDPLEGYALARAWTVGSEADGATARAAAAMLLGDGEMNAQALPLLTAARAASHDASEQLNLDLALSRVYRGLEQWQQAVEVSTRLIAAAPGSAVAFQSQQWARLQLKQWDAAESAARERLARKPDESVARRILVEIAGARGEFTKIPEILQPIIDSGRASPSDYNEYAWQALLVRPVPDKAAESARLAFEETQGRNFAIAHTLACVYAATGKPREARDLLLNGMTMINLDVPNDSSWYGFGLIAEAYGDTQSARDYYARVEKPKKREFQASSVYAMSQARLAALK